MLSGGGMDQYSQNKSINAISNSALMSVDQQAKKKNVSKVATRKYICIFCNIAQDQQIFMKYFSSIENSRKRTDMIFPEKHYI